MSSEETKWWEETSAAKFRRYSGHNTTQRPKHETMPPPRLLKNCRRVIICKLKGRSRVFNAQA